MRPMLLKLASLKLTLAAIGWLTFNVLLIVLRPETSVQWIVLPVTVLAMNLVAAIATNRIFRRQTALLVFHIGLLLVLVLIGLDVLTKFDAQIELVEGERFNADNVVAVNRGWLHPNRLDQVDFRQGRIEVNYRDGLQRGATQSDIEYLDGEASAPTSRIGDRIGFERYGYRFLATFNKGYSLLLRWDDGAGGSQLGTINFPSFPEYEWKQLNQWRTPTGEKLVFELRLPERIADEGAWTLRSESDSYHITVRREDGSANTLPIAGALQIVGGTLTIEAVRMWMGYRIDFHPLLPWMLAAAFLSLIALAVHFQLKFLPMRRTDRVLAVSRERTA